MPKQSSGNKQVKLVERPWPDGNVYVFEVTTVPDPDKAWDYFISNKLLGVKTPDGKSLIPAELPEPVPGAGGRPVGVMDILEWIGAESGIDKAIYDSTDLETAEKIISLARYWTLNPGGSLERFEEWQVDHAVPCPEGVSFTDCLDLLRHLEGDPSIRKRYFQARQDGLGVPWGLVVEITTIRSFRDYLNEVRYGYDQDGAGFSTEKRLILFDSMDRQPVCYTTPYRDMGSVDFVRHAAKELPLDQLTSAHIVLDGRCYPESAYIDLQEIFEDYATVYYLIRCQPEGKYIEPILGDIIPNIRRKGYSDVLDSGVYCSSRLIDVDLTHEVFMNGQLFTRTDQFRLAFYFALDTEKEKLENNRFQAKIDRLKEDLLLGRRMEDFPEADQKLIERCLTVKEHPVTGNRSLVEPNEEGIKNATRYNGYSVIVSNGIVDPSQALREVAFMEEMGETFAVPVPIPDAGSTPGTSEGVFFCQFVALGYIKFFEDALKELRRTLRISLDRPRSGRSAEKKRRIQRNQDLNDWLEGKSALWLLNWFDARQEAAADTSFAKLRWDPNAVERDRLFLKKLGVTE